MTDETSAGHTLQQFGVDVPDREVNDELDNSEDYKFTRPQCRAVTSSGSRCLNPTVRAKDADLCPRHMDMDDVRVVDDA